MYKSITLKAPAKINLILDIVGKRADGYHNLRSVMQTISIFDYVTLSVQGEKCRLPEISITCDRPDIPTNKRNIAYKACMAFFNHIGEMPFERITIHIEKNIPSGAGLGGGSSDGAAVLLGLNTLCGNAFSVEELCKIGATVGADVPFCIVGGTALCEGIGDIITPLKPLPKCEILVVKPDISISTPLSYKKFDELVNPKLSDFDAFMNALESDDLLIISVALSNSLEGVTDEIVIHDIKSDMLKAGALGSVMTGSGSAVFGIFDDDNTAKQCAEIFNGKMFCQICSSLKSGAEIIEE